MQSRTKNDIIETIFNKGIKGNVMAYISNEEINEIRSRANIVDIISDYMHLEKSGSNYTGLSSFNHCASWNDLWGI